MAKLDCLRFPDLSMGSLHIPVSPSSGGVKPSMMCRDLKASLESSIPTVTLPASGCSRGPCHGIDFGRRHGLL